MVYFHSDGSLPEVISNNGLKALHQCHRVKNAQQLKDVKEIISRGPTSSEGDWFKWTYCKRHESSDNLMYAVCIQYIYMISCMLYVYKHIYTYIYICLICFTYIYDIYITCLAYLSYAKFAELLFDFTFFSQPTAGCHGSHQGTCLGCQGPSLGTRRASQETHDVQGLWWYTCTTVPKGEIVFCWKVTP